MLSLIQGFTTASVMDGQRDEIVGYYQELKGNIDFTHMDESTNVSRRFSRPLKENIKLLKDIRIDIKSLKSLTTKARKIQPLSEAIMAESDIYKTISSLRTAERGTIAELTKIAEKTLMYEGKIETNTSGVNGATGGTSPIYQQFLSGNMGTGGYGAGINGAGIKTSSGSNIESIMDTIGSPAVIPPMEQESPLQFNTQTNDSNDTIVGSVREDTVSPVVQNNVPSGINLFGGGGMGVVSKNATKPQTPSSDVEVPGKVGFIDYGLSAQNLVHKKSNAEVVMCYNENTKEHYTAYKMADGTLDHTQPSLVMVSTLGKVSIDLSKMKARDIIGNSYNVVTVDSTPSSIVAEYEDIAKMK